MSWAAGGGPAHEGAANGPTAHGGRGVEGPGQHRPEDADAELDALGPFFTIGRHDPADPPAGGWRPLREITSEPAVLDERVAAVREFLAAGSGIPAGRVEVRVAASVAHLGMAARLTSPLLATAVLRGRVPRLTLDDLRWQATLGGAFPLSLPRSGGGGTAVAPPSSDAGAGTAALLVDDLALPLAAAFSRFGVSEPILRGNTASALAGAARMLAGAGRSGGTGGGSAPDARALVEELLRHPFLRGAGAYGGFRGFRRRSCCLIYRAAPARNGPLCGDCVLDRPAGRTR